MSIILAVDTSNYTTSACVFDTDNGIVWENRIPLSVESGACGIRQNDAVFLHTKNLRDLFVDISMFDFDCFAASDKPSEIENSYMPCFNVGISFASAMANIHAKPLFLCSHQKNHIAAAAFSANCQKLLDEKFIAYHVSGGTTDILLCTPDENNFSVTKIGGTADINCGQLIDRVGNMLSFAFPSGKLIEANSAASLSGNIRIVCRDGYYNFSGFQNKISDMISNSAPINDICTYTLDVVYSFLKKSINTIRSEMGMLPIIFSGGVMSNSIISGLIRNEFDNVFFSKPYYSVDNASGTAYLCSLKGDI